MSDPVRVAYVTMRFPWPSETFAVTEVRKLVRRGVDVRIFPLLPGASRHALAEPDNQGLESRVQDGPSGGRLRRALGAMLRSPSLVTVLMLWIVRTGWRRPGQIVRSLLLLPRSLEILLELRSDPPDVLHLFWGHYPSLVAVLVRRELPEVVISTFLGAYDLSMDHKGGRVVAREADCVITHACANLPTLARIGVPRARTHVVLRGIDLEMVDRICQGVPRETGRIVWVGRMIPEKGVLDALDVVRRLQERGEAVTFEVVGDGADRPRAEAAARSLSPGTVRFHGMLPHRDTLRVVAGADLMILLSTKPGERLPNVLKEAMAVGTIPVTWRTPGVEELVTDGVDGRVLPSGDLDGVVEAVSELLRGRGRAEAMQERARASMREAFDATRSAERLAAIWTDALGRSP